MTMIISGSTGLEFPDGSDQTTAAVATTPGGSTTQVQYNNAGAFGGDSGFVYSSGNVGIGTSSPSFKLQVSGDSSFTTTAFAGATTPTTASNERITISNSYDGTIAGKFYAAPATNQKKMNFGWNLATYGSGGSGFMIGGTRGIYSDGAGGTYISSDGTTLFGVLSADGFTNASPTFTERMRIDSSGNVMIGGTSIGTAATINLAIGSAGSTSGGITLYAGTTSSHSINFGDGTSGADNYRGAIEYAHNGNSMRFYTDATERMRIDSSGNLQFNSGYGSVQTAYGCRIWVNFNGQGTIAIRGSGGVSSLTDNGTVNYTVNFSITLPDTNYATAVTNDHDSGSGSNQQMFVLTNSNTSYANKSTTALQVRGYNTTSADFDPYGVNVMVFR